MDEFDLTERPRGVDALLGEIPVALVDERAWFASEVNERYADELALDAARVLGLAAALTRPRSAEELMTELRFVPAIGPALARLLARLAGAGHVDAEGDPPRYSLSAPLRASRAEQIRIAALARDPGLAPAFDLLATALAAYPEIAAGRTSGEEALLQPSRIALWLAYFDNSNPVYNLSNRIAAVAAANRIPASGPFSILELGAGGGSAAEALLEELERRGELARLERYHLTEPHSFFRRRAERALRARFPSVAFDVRALDLDRPFDGQGFHDRSDLVYGVNVVHVARDLGATLVRLGAALRPGGALVIGECVRLWPGQAIPADLVFELLDGFRSVELDPELRPHHGFLTPEIWRRALAAAGFDEVAVVPDLERIREHYPRFFAGAMVARAPVQSSSPEAP